MGWFGAHCRRYTGLVRQVMNLGSYRFVQAYSGLSAAEMDHANPHVLNQEPIVVIPSS